MIISERIRNIYPEKRRLGDITVVFEYDFKMLPWVVSRKERNCKNSYFGSIKEEFLSLQQVNK